MLGRAHSRTLRRCRKISDSCYFYECWSRKLLKWTKSFETFFDARVRVRECFRLLSHVWQCSVKFHRARLSVLCQKITTCSHATPSKLIPVCFQRARLSALGQIFSCWRAVLLTYWFLIRMSNGTHAISKTFQPAFFCARSKNSSTRVRAFLLGYWFPL